MVLGFKSYDLMGSVAILKFPRGVKATEKKKYALRLLKENNGIKTVLEKTGKFKGRLRKMETKFLAGEKTKEVLYKENNCVFRFNVDSTYFSPRLSNERKEIADLVKSGEEVLVMFAGVAPFSIVIAKNNKYCKVWSNEINKEANKYAQLNIELNKLKDKVYLLPGDVRKVAEKLTSRPPAHGRSALELPRYFDVIVMPRPQLKDSFLKEAFALSKKGTRIYYYDFIEAVKAEEIVQKVKEEAKKARKKIKITNVKRAGEVGPYKIRIRVDFEVL